MKFHRTVWVGVWLRICAFVAGWVCWAAVAQTNSWVSPTSGHWEDVSWSLGILPAADQSVMITNGGFKAVAISSGTAATFPGAMTVSNLTVLAPTNSQNTLLLNYAGTGVPMNVLSNCLIGTNGSVVSFYSGMWVNGDLTISNAAFVQEGGVTVDTNGLIMFESGGVALTNATWLFSKVISLSDSTFVQAGGTVTGSNVMIQSGTFNLYGGLFSAWLELGNAGSGTFNQYGGTNRGSIFLGENEFGFNQGTGTYNLHSGEVDAPEIQLARGQPSNGSFSQYGGTVTNGALTVGWEFDSTGNYSLYDGVLMSGGVEVVDGSFVQLGGRHVILGSLGISGFFDDYGPVYFGNYSLQGGMLTCGAIKQGVFGSFSQTGGTNRVGGDVSLIEALYSLSGGMLSDSNTMVGPRQVVGVDISLTGEFFQEGGLHWISNKLSCAGEYHLIAGTLVAPAIAVSGLLEIGANPAVVSNRVSLELWGTIALSNTVQRLAATVLEGNSAIHFESGNSRLTFADSHALNWTNWATLIISNWNGSAWGGGADQIVFGNSAGGLTPGQLQQIRFESPAGFPSGTWFAKILPTGEVVPSAVPPLAAALTATNLVVSWPTGNFVLQTATNLSGPFVDVPRPSPFTNNTTQFPRRFFRLRSP